MARSILLVFIILFFFSFANAQIQVNGKVYEYKTHIPLQSIRVINLKTRQTTVTDAAGKFVIPVKLGDALIFHGYAYLQDTLIITNAHSLEVYLQPQNNLLNEVKVNSSRVKTGSLTDPTLKGQTVVTQKDASGHDKGGIAIRFGYGESKKERLKQKLISDSVATHQIDELFSAQNVAKLVPLRGQTLTNFIAIYLPEIKAYKSPGFNFVTYVNDCYKKFIDLPADKRKPPALTKTTTAN